MVPLLISVYLFGQTLIYALFALLGQEAGIYNTLFYLAIFIFAIIFSTLRVIKRKVIKKQYLVGIFLCCLITIHHYAFPNENSNSTLSFSNFYVWGVASFLLFGVLDKNEIRSTVKYIEIINIVQAIAAILATFSYFLAGNRIVNYLSFGGETYNTISYVASTSMGLFLYYLFFSKEELRFSFMLLPIIRIFYWILIVLSIVTTFLSGGRGGAVLLIIYGLIFTIHFNKQKNKLAKKISVDIVLIALFIGLLYVISTNDALQASLSRTFSYITKSGIDFSQTSLRDSVYSSALKQIIERPIIGYGPLNYQDGVYPHNILLELLLSGGVIYFSLGLYLLVLICRKVIGSFAMHDEKLLMSFIFISTIVMLMFSGSFYTNLRFWALGTYFLCVYNNKEEKLAT